MNMEKLSNIVLLPKFHHSIEDFLDFSRFRLPTDWWILKKRIEWNSRIFLGNYMSVTWLVLLSTSRNLVQILSLFFLTFLWIGLCVVHKILSSSSRLTISHASVRFDELFIVFSILSNAILFLFGTLQRTYAFSCLGMLICCCHALLRPVPKELSKKRDKKVVVASDGFTDDSEDIVEFISSPNSRPTSTKRSPGPQCIKRVKIQSLVVPLAVESQ